MIFLPASHFDVRHKIQKSHSSYIFLIFVCMKVGIIFGGQSREREISFAGGRTVYDNLDKTLFKAIPIFVDSFGNFVQLAWSFLYKGSIRDFYPPMEFVPTIEKGLFQVYAESLGKLSVEEQDELLHSLGKKITPSEIKELIDFAFLTLHGAYGEDGAIQGLLQFLNIPYTGSGILPSALGMNKAFQKKMMEAAGFAVPKYTVIQRTEWIEATKQEKLSIFSKVDQKVGFPCVIKAATQGSSIGAGRVMKKHFVAFEKAVNNSLFLYQFAREEWNALSTEEEFQFIRNLTDIRSGLGLPLLVHLPTERILFYQPDSLYNFVRSYFLKNDKSILLEALDKENEVIIESFLTGKEFSCIVIKNEQNHAVALPPTEIRKGTEIYDYRSKYLPGLSRKITPINLPTNQIEKIRKACTELFNYFRFHTYARIDGFINAKGKIFLNDPNTTSGMLPSSFFFHQAAEIGLNPSQFLTYIIRTSLQERINHTTNSYFLRQPLQLLDKKIASLKSQTTAKKRVGVILGGYSSERHISVESGRNIYEKLASSEKYVPIPIFLTGNDKAYQLYEIPINVLLKDNADDIKEKVLNFSEHPIIEQIKEETNDIREKYCSTTLIDKPQLLTIPALAEKVDMVFIALHGRPGEDGNLQHQLEKYNIPYNGSSVQTSQITIDKYATNQLLKKHGFSVAKQLLVEKTTWLSDKEEVIKHIEQEFTYPIILKPSDDGCSSAVKKIDNSTTLKAYITLIFREEMATEFEEKLRKVLGLKSKEEFPVKTYFLVEELIEKGTAKHFLEITGGLVTHQEDEHIVYEMFEPSETLAGEAILSLEEKFLAGQGQNITPARYAPNPLEQERIAEKVKSDLQKVAEILHIEGYARIDAFVKIYTTGQIETFIIEINSLPGVTPATCIFHQCALNGYTPYEFIDQVLTYAANKTVTKQPV